MVVEAPTPAMGKCSIMSTIAALVVMLVGMCAAFLVGFAVGVMSNQMNRTKERLEGIGARLSRLAQHAEIQPPGSGRVQ